MKEKENKLLSALRETNAQPTSWHRFMLHWPEVREALEQGYTIRDVHNALVSQERWHGGYEGFRQFVGRARGTAALPAAQSGKNPTAAQRRNPAQTAVQRHRALLEEKMKANPMHERLERPAYDYANDPHLSDLARELIGRASDDDM